MPPRLAVLTDIGGDPDDQQSLIRLMVYADCFRIEALIATSAGIVGQLKEPIIRPDLIREIVGAYGRVLPNLRRHGENWPSQQQLMDTVRTGSIARGLEAVGEGKDTEASNHLIQCVDKGSTRDPLHISIWGGQTDLAQALWRVKHSRGTEGMQAFVKKFKVFDIGDQDRLADWMHTEFPGMVYILPRPRKGADIRLTTYRGMYLTGDLDTTSRQWIDANIRSTGPLGALYPQATWTAPNPHVTLKEGDTPSWFFWLPQGGNNPDDPTQPGWGGRYIKSDDGRYVDLPFTEFEDPRREISRWRPVFQADFARRMAWCRP
jgi:hypothetical protein